jgi:hypothetical protein
VKKAAGRASATSAAGGAWRFPQAAFDGLFGNAVFANDGETVIGACNADAKNVVVRFWNRASGALIHEFVIARLQMAGRGTTERSYFNNLVTLTGSDACLLLGAEPPEGTPDYKSYSPATAVFFDRSGEKRRITMPGVKAFGLNVIRRSVGNSDHVMLESADFTDRLAPTKQLTTLTTGESPKAEVIVSTGKLLDESVLGVGEDLLTFAPASMSLSHYQLADRTAPALPRGAGGVYLTAGNEGATAVTRIFVLPGDPSRAWKVSFALKMDRPPPVRTSRSLRCHRRQSRRRMGTLPSSMCRPRRPRPSRSEPRRGSARRTMWARAPM